MKIRGFYNNLNIRKKLLFIFCIQIFVPLLLVTFLVFQKSESVIRNQALTMTQDVFKLVEIRFQEFSNQVENISQDFLYDEVIYDVLNHDGIDKFDYYNHVNALKSLLRKITLSRSEIRSITFVSRNREFYSYDLNSGSANIEKMIPYDYLIQIARQAEGRSVWFVDKQGENINVFVSRIVNDKDTYNEIGMMAILLDISKLEDDFSKMSSDMFRDLIVINEDSQIIISKGNEDDLISILESQVLKDQYGAFYSDNMSKLITYRQFNEPNWMIITGIENSVLLKDFESLITWIAAILIPLIIMLSILSIKTAMTIVSPINRLVTGMKNVKVGEQHDPIVIERNDELGFLSTTFNEMSEEIDHLVRDIYKEQLTRKEVELKALQAQINPHFLFNTLETINWRAQLKGAPEISNMVTSLSSIMEASIGRDNKLIAIKDELMYIDNYMSIMKYRYEDRLVYEKEVDNKIKFKKIPRLLLQPIFENAINHGIAKTSKIGLIKLIASIKSGDITMIIEDNGVGLEAKIVDDINDMLNDNLNHHIDQNGGSVGLANVNQRIKLFYGKGYGVRVESVLGDYTKVIIKIPFDFEDKGDGYYVQSTNY